MEFGVLGSVAARDCGQPLEIPRGKPTALLALLLLHRNTAVSSDRLIDELWGEAAPKTAAKTLQLYVSQLRKVLPSDVLLTQPPGYLLRAPAGAVDADRFERLLAEGRDQLERADPSRAAVTLRDALGLWRGPAFADVTYEAFVHAESERLEELRLEAFEERVEADLRCGRHAEVVGELTAVAAEHPLRERLKAQLMLTLYRCGRQSEALAVFSTTRRRLHDELGIEPGRELRELEGAILRHDESLSAPKRPRVSGARATAAHPSRIAVAAIVVAAVAIAATVSVAAALRSSGEHTKALPNSIVRVDDKGHVTRA
jgi:DNA-binding SARP family transcriptional activator